MELRLLSKVPEWHTGGERGGKSNGESESGPKVPSGVVPFANDLGGIASLLQQLWKQDLRVWDTSNYVLGSIRCGREGGREGG